MSILPVTTSRGVRVLAFVGLAVNSALAQTAASRIVTSANAFLRHPTPRNAP